MKKKSLVRSMNRSKWGGPLKREVRKPVPSSSNPKSLASSKAIETGKRKANLVGDSDSEEDGEKDESQHSSNEGSDSSGGLMEVMIKQYLKRKSKKRKGKHDHGGLSKKAFESEGHRVMQDGVVLRTHNENVGKQPNVVCRVDKFCEVVRKFDATRREVVESMGFGGLLHLDMKVIPRQFCYWLMTRVFADGTMVFGDGTILPLGPSQVRSILGIPMGNKEVPLVLGDSEEDTQKIVRVFKLYGVGVKGETVSLNLAAAALCPQSEDGSVLKLESEVDKEDFMTAFLIVALGMVVCSTTNSSNLAASLVPTLVVACEAGNYDWCKFTLDWVRDSADRFQRKFQKDGFRGGCGGSIVFLLIFYLDHLHRVPTCWGIYPRVKVWDTETVRAVVDEDRKSDEEFGQLPVLDIAYGEFHPLVARDGEVDLVDKSLNLGQSQVGVVQESAVHSMADQVLALLTPRLVSLVEGIVVNALGGSGSKAGLPKTGEEMNTLSTGKGSQPRHSGSSNKALKSKPPKERCRNEGNDSSSGSYFSDAEELGVVSRETCYDKRLETFVKAWKELKDENNAGPILIQCDEMYATQRDCYGVIGPRARLGHQYVRVASVMYTKHWGELEFLKRRKRILIDPSFAMMIKANERDYENLARKYCKLLLRIPIEEIRIVFFPVLDGCQEKSDEHWWCLCIDVVKRELWLIDSLYNDPYERHGELLTELVKAVDLLFQLKDPVWEVGSVQQWSRHVVPMVKQTDTYSCGVLMLGCIKHSARSSFETGYPVERNLRRRLFLEDANNTCNEVAGTYDELLPKERVRPKRTTTSQQSSQHTSPF